MVKAKLHLLNGNVLHYYCMEFCCTCLSGDLMYILAAMVWFNLNAPSEKQCNEFYRGMVGPLKGINKDMLTSF